MAPPWKKTSLPRISPRTLTADDDRASRFCADIPRNRHQDSMASVLPLMPAEEEKWEGSLKSRPKGLTHFQLTFPLFYFFHLVERGCHVWSFACRRSRCRGRYPDVDSTALDVRHVLARRRAGRP